MSLNYHDGEGWTRTSWAQRKRFSDAYLCCPGPSLAGMDTAQIRGPGATVVAMTTAYPTVYPDLWFGSDRPECYDSSLWFQPFPKVTTNWQRGESAGGAMLYNCPNMFFADIEEVAPIQMFARMCRDVKFVWPKNTFWFTLHVLIWMGFRRIHLLGCDMGGKKDYCHDKTLSPEWHDFNAKLYDKLARELRAGTPDMRKRGVELISCTPASPINDFLKYLPMDYAVRKTRARYALPPSSEVKHCREVPPGRIGPRCYHIKGYRGLGDTVYMLPFIRNFAKQCKAAGDTLYISTPWPQLMAGIDAKLVQDHCGLWAQEKNLTAHVGDDGWNEAPEYATIKGLSYDGKKFKDGRTIIDMFNECLPLNGAPLDMHLEIPTEWKAAARAKVNTDKPVVFARPVTLRRASPWMAIRNCKQAVVQRTVAALADRYHVVSCADADGFHETLPDGPLAGVDQRFDAGELSLEEMIGMMAVSACLVGPVGFIIPFGIAMRKPTMAFFGGGEPPAALTDPEMDLSRLVCVGPGGDVAGAIARLGAML